ncbi:50S ribosomal protein L11 methyltransferase [Methylobacterium oryzihabitans]|uniref:Ribosomal protein L11 methyltransferase n=1 Tax=Methylobacterium oryzihabitans TaxID=2499852 RepID=A0A3S2VAV3_9HYPH|nr:50S ribosomal protein L11 methyltransferase [Methylobacterium oryzihabitans]RVU20058.1 50S ribosomal protein L11 methyltransferase [Methylobacterium oryzihabitans]
MLEGLPPHRPTHVLRLDTDERAARAMTDLIGEVFDPTETAVAAFEAEDGRTWRLEAYFSDAPDEDAVREMIRPIVGDAADAAEFTAIDQQDWVRASLEGLKPVRAGRILVHGSHDRGQVRANDRPIEIEAALAFGTGHHGTTLGCLLALTDELRRRRPRRVLDVGTGTGILGLAAATSLRARVVAGDLDPEAVFTARANARLNGLHGRMAFYEAPGVRHPLADRPRGFDLVFANILARPLTRLAPSLARVLTPDGTLVLSGLIPRDVPGVLSAYAAQGLRLRRRRVIEGWVSLVLGRGGAAPRPR